VDIRGKSSHAGFAPEHGVHAIAVAAEAISKLKMGRAGDDTTINIGSIEGGKATNIVPDRCMVKGEIRSYSHGKALMQIGMIKTLFENAASAVGATVEFGVHLGCTAYETDINHSVVRRFTRACEELLLPFKLTETFGGSDNNVLIGHNITGIVIATAMNEVHSCSEYTTTDELGRIADLTLALMTKLS
jgi:tripeptide aminopeptidase